MNLLSILCALLSLFGDGDISLVFAGDAMQHERQLKAAETLDGFDYSDCFRHVRTYVSSADFAVVNLECTLGGKPYTGYPCFSAPDVFAEALRNAGFDLFLHANNHCLDRRDKGLIRTLDALDRMGIPHIGTYRNRQERDSGCPYVADVKGLKVGFLNYTYGTNGIEPREVCVDYINRQQMSSDIRELRKMGADLIVVCVHWGLEYKLRQNGEQESLADFLVKEGVDLIIGSHPHVVQPMEVRHSEKHGKDVLVVYSLGNFISGMRTSDTRGGAMVRVVLGRQNGKPCLKQAVYRLVFVQDPDNDTPNYQLIPSDRTDLVRCDSQPAFRKFVMNARGVLNRYNVTVEEDDWKWTPIYEIPWLIDDFGNAAKQETNKVVERMKKN